MNPIKWLKDRWDFYNDWYDLDEKLYCFLIGAGIALLWALPMILQW